MTYVCALLAATVTHCQFTRGETPSSDPAKSALQPAPARDGISRFLFVWSSGLLYQPTPASTVMKRVRAGSCSTYEEDANVGGGGGDPDISHGY